jgi:hypothetical protein
MATTETIQRAKLGAAALDNFHTCTPARSEISE